jgi:hypothetical protein
MLKSAWHNGILGELMDSCPQVLAKTFGPDRAPFLYGRAEVALKRYVKTLPQRVERLSNEWRVSVKKDDPHQLPQVERALTGLAMRLTKMLEHKLVIPALPVEITDQNIMVPIQRALDSRGKVRPNPVTVDYFDFEASVTMAIGVRYKSSLDWLVDKHGAILELIREAPSNRGAYVLKQISELELTPELEVEKGSVTLRFVLVPPTFSLGETLTRLNELHEAKERENAEAYTQLEDLSPRDRFRTNRWTIVLVAEDRRQLQAALLSGFSTLDAVLLGSDEIPRIVVPKPARGSNDNSEDKIGDDALDS